MEGIRSTESCSRHFIKNLLKVNLHPLALCLDCSVLPAPYIGADLVAFLSSVTTRPSLSALLSESWETKKGSEELKQKKVLLTSRFNATFLTIQNFKWYIDEMLFSSATKIASQQNRIFEMVYLIFEGLYQIFWTVVFVTWDSVFDNHWDPCIFTISINQHQSESISISQHQSVSIRINQHQSPAVSRQKATLALEWAKFSMGWVKIGCLDQ